MALRFFQEIRLTEDNVEFFGGGKQTYCHNRLLEGPARLLLGPRCGHGSRICFWAERISRTYYILFRRRKLMNSKNEEITEFTHIF